MSDETPRIVGTEISGSWSLRYADALAKIAPASPWRSPFQGENISALDTTGAMYLLKLIGSPESISGLTKRHRVILELVNDRFKNDRNAFQQRHRPRVLARIGKGLATFLNAFATTNNFLGRSATSFWATAQRPKSFRMKEFIVQLERCCLDAIAIVALVTFLIGIVIAYLSAIQLEKYGANIFVVDGVALAMCRELSPVIVAIIVAGRSGSAFTAQLGTMKLNEEIDALETLGLSTMEVIVLPRILALIIAMPLLVFVGDVVGITGGALIADSYLDVTLTSFLDRLQTFLAPKHFWVGIIKAPVFALFVGLIGCRMGLSVENNARSVGLNTTSTVVQSIVAVILLNAGFAVIFVELGI